jgi:hypothetical protein
MDVLKHSMLYCKVFSNLISVDNNIVKTPEAFRSEGTS